MFTQHTSLEPHTEINVFVTEGGVRKRKEHQAVTQVVWGKGWKRWHVEVFHPMDQAFNGAHHRVTERGSKQTGDVSYRSNESTSTSVTWPKVTKPVQSKSGDLYLALQMARYGLCLGGLSGFVFSAFCCMKGGRGSRRGRGAGLLHVLRPALLPLLLHFASTLSLTHTQKQC